MTLKDCGEVWVEGGALDCHAPMLIFGYASFPSESLVAEKGLGWNYGLYLYQYLLLLQYTISTFCDTTTTIFLIGQVRPYKSNC